MPSDLATLVKRTRNFMRDRPDLEALSASLASTATTIAVTDGTKYVAGERLEIDFETILIRSISSNTLTVARGMFESTAASHASSASILRNPAFIFSDYRDALNAGIDACFPLLYRPVVDESLSAVANTYEYTVPNMPATYEGDSVPIPYISRVSVKETGTVPFRRYRDWYVNRGTTPKLVFRRDPSPGTIRIYGFGPFPYLSATSDLLDTLFPKRAERLLTEFASNWLLASGEAGRVRLDTGAVDAREQANRTGSSLAAASALFQRFQLGLAAVAMPPMPKHLVPTF